MCDHAVWQFIDHFVSDVVGLGCRERIDEALEVHFLNDHLVQGQTVFVGKHGLGKVGFGVVGYGVVVDKGNRELPGILLGYVHASADTPADVDDAPLGLGRMVFIGCVWLLLHALPDADNIFLDKVFVPSCRFHQVWHQGVEFVLDHGVKRLMCCHCLGLLPPNAKRAPPPPPPPEFGESPSLLGFSCGCFLCQ
jgi:hypothetical protein